MSKKILPHLLPRLSWISVDMPLERRSTLVSLSVHGIVQRPELLQTLNPAWGVQFFVVHTGVGVAIFWCWR